MASPTARTASPRAARCAPASRCFRSTPGPTTARSSCRPSTASAPAAGRISPARRDSPASRSPTWSPSSSPTTSSSRWVRERTPARASRPPCSTSIARVTRSSASTSATTRSSAARCSTSTATSSTGSRSTSAARPARPPPRRSSRSRKSWSIAPACRSWGSASGRPASSTSVASCSARRTSDGWRSRCRPILAAATGYPVLVANDANAAALAEHSFGDALSDMMLIKVGHGVGAGLLLDGVPLFGSRFAAGEIGHVVVGTDGGAACACGKHGCLETWLAAPRLTAKLEAAANAAERDDILRRAGERLGIALAPVVGALNLGEVVLSGPARTARWPSRRGGRRHAPQSHDGRVPRRSHGSDDHARSGHRHARRRRHGAVRTTRGLLRSHPCTSGVAARLPRTSRERKTP